MMQYHFKRYYIVDIKCSTSDIIVLSQKAVFTVFEISEKLRVQKVQHVIYFACKCELNSFKWIKDMKWMWICDPNCIVQETGRIRAENEHHTLGFQLFTKETHKYSSYGITMEQESWVSISFPYQISSLPGWYGNWEYQMAVWLMIWEWYGELPSIYHLHSRESGNIWYWYGAEPYHSHATYYGECMGCYQIRSNPIVKIYWTIYWWRLLTHMGLIWHVVSFASHFECISSVGIKSLL